jgi:HlyD family secretion protein
MKDYDLLKGMRSSLQTQKELHEHNLELMNETYKANDSLFRDKVVSRQDLRDQDSRLTDRKISIPQLENSILSNESQQINKQKQIEELEHAISQQKGIFRQELQTLQSKVENWTQQYIITAPIEGKITFIVPLQENQFILAGKVVGYVNPPDSRYYAQITLPQNNFGKISTGQKVQLRFDAYPYQEFGFVEGDLDYISKIPTDSGFLATVALPSGLVTCYKKQLQYRNGLRSQALVITKDMRLLQRLYYNLLNAMKR